MSEGKEVERFRIELSEECSLHNVVCAGLDNGNEKFNRYSLLFRPN